MAVRLQFNDLAIRALTDSPAVAREVDRLAAQLVQAAKVESPVSPVASGHSGHLRSSIHAYRQGDGSVIVGPSASYSRYVVDGTPPHEIRSHGSWPLRDNLGHVFGPLVHHPGTAPNRFMQRALQRVRAANL